MHGEIWNCTSLKSDHPLLRPFTFPMWHQQYHNIVVPSLSTGHQVLEGEENEVPPLGSFPSVVSHCTLPQCWYPTCDGCPQDVSTHVDSEWKCQQPSCAPGTEQGEERAWLCPTVSAALWATRGSQQAPTPSKLCGRGGCTSVGLSSKAPEQG